MGRSVTQSAQPTEPTVDRAVAVFEAAWNDPRTTSVELPPVDVNRVLAEQYQVDPPTRMTRNQVWDMEVKKAWDPLTYIPYVVSEGVSWAAVDLPDGRRHLRFSVQKAWLKDDRGRVLEEVFIDPAGRRVIFLGQARMTGPHGETLLANSNQPLFHVEHGVGGTEDDPVNQWRIVVLTKSADPRYATEFAKATAAGGLPASSSRSIWPATSASRSSGADPTDRRGGAAEIGPPEGQVQGTSGALGQVKASDGTLLPSQTTCPAYGAALRILLAGFIRPKTGENHLIAASAIATTAILVTSDIAHSTD